MHVSGVLKLVGKRGVCVIVVDEDIEEDVHKIHSHVRASRLRHNSLEGAFLSNKRPSLKDKRFLSGTKVICNLKGGKVSGWTPAPIKGEQILVFVGKSRKPSFQGSMHQVVAWIQDNEFNLRDLTIKKKAPNGNWHEMLIAGLRIKLM